MTRVVLVDVPIEVLRREETHVERMHAVVANGDDEEGGLVVVEVEKMIEQRTVVVGVDLFVELPARIFHADDFLGVSVDNRCFATVGKRVDQAIVLVVFVGDQALRGKVDPTQIRLSIVFPCLAV